MKMNENVQHILPWAITAAAISYALYATFVLSKKKRVNTKIQLDSNKVVHSVDIEDVGKKTVFCRCWKSDKDHENKSEVLMPVAIGMHIEIFMGSIYGIRIVASVFPYCDGSHNKHNECNGDNVGPLIVKQKDA